MRMSPLPTRDIGKLADRNTAVIEQQLPSFSNDNGNNAQTALLIDGVNTLVHVAHKASADAGWWIDPASGRDLAGFDWFKYVIGAKLMLVVSEVSEAMEGHRKGLMDDKLPHRPMIEVEFADAFIRLADLAGKLGLDVGGAIVEKMAFNAVRPDHKIKARTASGGKSY